MFDRVLIVVLGQKTLSKFVQPVSGLTKQINVLNQLNHTQWFHCKRQSIQAKHLKINQIIITNIVWPIKTQRHLLRTLLFKSTYIEMEAVLRSNLREHIRAEVQVLNENWKYVYQKQKF